MTAECESAGSTDPASERAGPGNFPLLEADGLTVHYPVRRPALTRRGPRRYVKAVDGVTLTIDQGEMLALVGESGCGKTSVAQSVMRMVDLQAGSLKLQGRDITTLSQRRLKPLRRSMQMIYQDPYESLDPRFRVRQTIEEPLRVHGTSSRSERRERVLGALAAVDLLPPDLYLERHPHELSGGQRQRVAIAASLVLDPALLLADEPVSMLDVSVRAGILQLLRRLCTQRGLGVLMITHDLSTAAHFADRIAVMYLGRIVEEGRARDVIGDPRHPYTKALISAVPRRHPGHAIAPQILKGELPDPVDVPTGCRFHTRCPVAAEECPKVDPGLWPSTGDLAGSHRAACILVERQSDVAGTEGRTEVGHSPDPACRSGECDGQGPGNG